MKIIGNILWVLLGGLFSAACWLVLGCLWCITIIGIPVGMQCFKFAKLCLLPFGKVIVYGNGTASVLVNILWLIFGGLELAIGFFVVGCIFCVTIIGIPFGMQYFKFAKLSLMPFGASIRKV
jgi:uncharacterized membrane protein YccF (DUF307 family)